MVLPAFATRPGNVLGDDAPILSGQWGRVAWLKGWQEVFASLLLKNFGKVPVHEYKQS